MVRAKFWLAVIVGLLILPGISLAATDYTITGIAPAAGDNFSAAYSINDSDQIVGIMANLNLSDPLGSDNSIDAGSSYLDTNGVITPIPNLGTNSLGKDFTLAAQINDSGEVVGVASTSSIPGGDTAITFQNGVLTNLASELGTFDSAAAEGINASGEVVGGIEFAAQSAGNSPFLISNGTAQFLGFVPGFTVGGAIAINASGEAVGFEGSKTIAHAVLFENGTVQDLGTLSGDADSVASAINSQGNIVGFSAAATNGIKPTTSGEIASFGTGVPALTVFAAGGGAVVAHAFFYNAKTQAMSDLGTLGGTFSDAFSINDSNQIVGDSTTAAGDFHAFIDNGSAMVDLNSLIPADSGWTLITADSINNKGDIAGFGIFDGTYEGYFLTAGGTISGSGGNGGNSGGSSGGSSSGTGGAVVPLPSAAWSGLLFLIALSGMAIARSRRPA